MAKTEGEYLSLVALVGAPAFFLFRFRLAFLVLEIHPSLDMVSTL